MLDRFAVWFHQVTFVIDFFLDVNNTLDSLSLLKTKPLFLDHALKFLMSTSRNDIVDWIFVMEFDRYNLLPSAYWIELDFKHDGNDETNILNKTGPRMLSCGTPKYIGRSEDFLSSGCTYCSLLLRLLRMIFIEPLLKFKSANFFYECLILDCV